MRFSCEKALLQAAINTASRAVSAKSSIPALEGLLLQAGTALTVSGYNMQTGIRTKVAADVTEEGELAVEPTQMELPEDLGAAEANPIFAAALKAEVSPPPEPAPNHVTFTSPSNTRFHAPVDPVGSPSRGTQIPCSGSSKTPGYWSPACHSKVPA